METECSNSSNTFSIDTFLKENELLKKSKHTGKGYCNYVSASIMKLVRNKEITSKFTFVHIPKNMNSDLVSKNLNDVLFDIIKK